MFPPVVLALGGILEGYSDCTPGGIKDKQGFNGEELDVNQGCASGLPLLHPHPVSVVEPAGTSTVPASLRDRQSLTRKEKLLV